MNSYLKKLIFIFTFLINVNLFGVNYDFNKVFAESLRNEYNASQKRSLNNAQFKGTGEMLGTYLYVDDNGWIHATENGNKWIKIDQFRYGYRLTTYDKNDQCKQLEALTLLSGNIVDHCIADVPIHYEAVIEGNYLVLYEKRGETVPKRYVFGVRR